MPILLDSDVYESHPSDSRIKGPIACSPTVTAKWHKGSADTPLVHVKSGTASGKEVFPTLCAEVMCRGWTGAQETFSGDHHILEEYDVKHGKENMELKGTVYAVCGKSSNGMKSANPYTGCVYKANVARTLDTTIPEPTKGQGGMMVMENDVYSMGHDERNAQFQPNVADPLTASDYKQPTVANDVHGRVRRLTPTECERLQGLPDGWTAGGKDSHRYKAIGNGMAQPCADFVLKCVVDRLKEEDDGSGRGYPF